MTNEERLSILSQNESILRKRTYTCSRQADINTELLCDLICNDTNGGSALDVWNRFLRLLPDASAKEKLMLCVKFCISPALTKEISELVTIGSSDETPAGTHGKICYVRNRYNDLAFQSFEKKVRNAKPVIVSSFIESCESVFDGKCEFCILPLENTVDGKHFGFYSMIDRYELKICAVCNIEAEDQYKSIKYALIGRGCEEPQKNAKDNGEYIFEFSLSGENAIFAFDMLDAAKAIGGVPISFDSIPVQYDDKQIRYFFTLRLRDDALSPFRLFLALNYSGLMPIGLYPAKNNI